MRVTTKGQVTIPQPIRELLGIVPSSDIEFVQDHSSGRVYIHKKPPGAVRGKSIVDNLRGRAETDMTTAEIMRLTRGETS